mgnify:CR=1 FL=1
MTQPQHPPEWLKEWATVAAKLAVTAGFFLNAIQVALELLG